MPASKDISVLKTYAGLRRGVESALLAGQRRIDAAWVRTYWDTGRLIHEHLLRNKERANYGTQIVARLSGDLHVSERLLYQCLQFARRFPILHGRAEFTWAHYRLLCQVEDETQRQALIAQTARFRWTSPQLELQVRALAPAGDADGTATPATGTPPKLLTPKRGTPGVCKVIAVGDELVVDLGFASYLDLPPDASYAAGSFVQMDAAGRITAAPDAGKADLFTYTAAILKVVDGDTLWVKIYLRPRHWVKHKLRLRDLDAPEISTPEGKAAKRFVDALVAQATAVTICTTKPDKYDRYLADVFVSVRADSSPQPSTLNSQPPASPVFLNNALLAVGHAVPKKAWEFSDWGE